MMRCGYLQSGGRVSSGFAHGATALAMLLTTPSLAHAAAGFGDISLESGIVGFAFSGGLALFSAAVSIAHIRERGAWRRREAALLSDLQETRAKFDRAKIFLASEPQILVAWASPESEADVSASTLPVMEASAAAAV